MLKSALLGLGVLLLALGASASWGVAASLWDLRQIRLHGQARARTAQEDYATNPYWLALRWKLDATVSGILFASGGGLLWVRSRLRG